jgi:hypothetical protein
MSWFKPKKSAEDKSAEMLEKSIFPGGEPERLMGDPFMWRSAKYEDIYLQDYGDGLSAGRRLGRWFDTIQPGTAASSAGVRHTGGSIR